MALVFKVNTAKIIRKNGLKKNKSGFLIVPVAFMRTGILLYRDWDTGNIVREYVSPDELFKPESMASASGSLFTEDHPPDMVYPDNWTKYGLGSIHSPKQNGVFIEGLITVYDPETIRSIEKEDKDEVSAGYWVNTISTPGISPEGEEYDAQQKDIEYNHIARVWFGRAGEEVSLKKNARRNGADYPVHFEINNKDIFKFNEEKKIIMIINGRDVKLSEADEVFMDQFLKEQKKEVEAKKNEADQLKTKTSTLEAELDLTRKNLEDLQKKDFKKEYEERLNLENYTRPILGKDFKYDGLSDLEIKRNFMDKIHPDLDFKNKEEAYVKSGFDIYKKQNEKTNQEDQERFNGSERDFFQTRENLQDIQGSNQTKISKTMSETFKRINS